MLFLLVVVLNCRQYLCVLVEEMLDFGGFLWVLFVMVMDCGVPLFVLVEEMVKYDGSLWVLVVETQDSEGFL